jgi:phage terminase small subunit
MPKASNTITQKQSLFLDYILDGEKQGHAYQLAYGCSEATAIAQATKILKKPHIKAELARRRKDIAHGRVLSRLQSRQILHEIATKHGEDASKRIQAIKEDNQMTGRYKPVQVSAELTFKDILQGVADTTDLPSLVKSSKK